LTGVRFTFSYQTCCRLRTTFLLPFFFQILCYGERGSVSKTNSTLTPPPCRGQRFVSADLLFLFPHMSFFLFGFLFLFSSPLFRPPRMISPSSPVMFWIRSRLFFRVDSFSTPFEPSVLSIFCPADRSFMGFFRDPLQEPRLCRPPPFSQWR